MDELDNENEEIDQELRQLEIHAPSMRFAKNVVEAVRLNDDLIQEDQRLLPWIPKVCIGGFALIMATLVVLLISNKSELNLPQMTQIIQLLTNALFVLGGLLLFLSFDRLLKHLLIRR